MKDEIVSAYEADLKFYIKEVAYAQIERKEAVTEFEDGLYGGMNIAYMMAVRETLMRLEHLIPGQLHFDGLLSRDKYIEAAINQEIREKTNANKKS